MGLEYEAFLNMTWREYDFYSIGYLRRLERQWDYTRHLIASNFNSSGMTKSEVKPTDIMKLQILDDVKEKPLKKVDNKKLEQMRKHLEQWDS